MKRNWAVFPVCAIKDDSKNLAAAMQWLIDNIDDVKNPKKIVHVGVNLNTNSNSNKSKGQ